MTSTMANGDAMPSSTVVTKTKIFGLVPIQSLVNQTTKSDSDRSDARIAETITGAGRSIIKSMSETEQPKKIVEALSVTRRSNGRIGFECPHCDHTLPVNRITECDECGAHLELLVRTTAPPVWFDDMDVDDESESL